MRVLTTIKRHPKDHTAYIVYSDGKAFWVDDAHRLYFIEADKHLPLESQMDFGTAIALHKRLCKAWDLLHTGDIF